MKLRRNALSWAQCCSLGLRVRRWQRGGLWATREQIENIKLSVKLWPLLMPAAMQLYLCIGLTWQLCLCLLSLVHVDSGLGDYFFCKSICGKCFVSSEKWQSQPPILQVVMFKLLVLSIINPKRCLEKYHTCWWSQPSHSHFRFWSIFFFFLAFLLKKLKIISYTSNWCDCIHTVCFLWLFRCIALFNRL